MKKKYETPIAHEETFMANEYVAACWGVACAVDAANAVEKIMPATNPDAWGYSGPGSNNYKNGQTHSAKQCGISGNQVIKSNSSGIAIGMDEINTTTGTSTLSCDLYTDASYTTRRDYSTVKSQDYVYWTTKTYKKNGSVQRIWYHQGPVTGTVPGHPNRS